MLAGSAESENSHQFLFRKAWKEYPLWILILLCLLYFFRPVFLGECFYFRDLSNHIVIARQIWKAAVLHGGFPLWNPYLNSGQPFYANPNSSALYPSNLFYLIFPIWTALTVEIVFHYILAVVGVFLFSRSEGLSKTSAFIASVIYGLSGVSLSLANLMNSLFGFALLPYVLLFWKLFLQRRKVFLFCMVILTATLEIFAGTPEILLFTLAMMLAWTFFQSYEQSIKKRLTSFVLAAALMIAVSAIQILPAMRFNSQTMRGAGLEYHFATGYSIHPKRTPEFIFSEFLGHYDDVYSGSFWGAKLEDNKAPFYLSIYVGPIAILLAACSFCRKHQWSSFKNLKIYVLGFMIICGGLLCLGRYLPGFEFLFHHLPGFNMFRYPSKFLILSLLPFCLLAAEGFETLLKREYNRAIFLSFGWIFCIAIWIAAAWILLTASASTVLFDHQWSSVPQELRYSLIRSSLFLFVPLLFIQFRRLPHWMIPVLLTIDLLIAGQFVNFYADKNFYKETPNVVKFIDARITDPVFYRSPSLPTTVIRTPSPDLFWRYRWNRELLSLNHSAFYLIPRVFGFDLEASLSYEISKMTFAADHLPPEKKLPLLSAGGVNVILSPEKFEVPGTELLARITNSSTNPFYLYKNDQSIGHAQFVPNYISLPNCDDAIHAMLSPNYDPQRFVILKGTASSLHLQSCGNQNKTRMISRSMNSFVFESNAECDGYLVFPDSYDPGWNVLVDGSRVPLLQANCSFSAIALTKGQHKIQKTYVPEGFKTGAIISMISVCSLLVALLYRRPRAA